MRGNKRGRGRGRGKINNARQPIRPLMNATIENIDFELELLKQKREMIEQHQLMLESQRMCDQQRHASEKHYSNKARYKSPGPSRSERNFTRYYEDPIKKDYSPLSSNRKRPADPRWSGGSQPKRSSSRSQGGGTQFGSHSSPKTVENATRTSQTGFIRPNKKRSKSKGNEHVVNDEDFVLRPGQESQKVKGRLEFAFGFILKQMKEDFGGIDEFTQILFHDPYKGMLKTALRERIRVMMLNKVVQHGQEVVEIYRKKYPVDTDAAFMRKVRKDINANTANVLQETDNIIAAPMNPVNYIKSEIGKVIDAEMNTFIRKLEIIHNPKLSESVKEQRLRKVSNEVPPIQDNEKDTEAVKLWKRMVHKKIKENLPGIMIKNIPMIIKFMQLDLVYINTWTAMMNKAKDSGEAVHKLDVGIDTETAFAPRFCARVRGIPKLPPKIRQFLEPFKPIWVKKNKMTRNLIYAAFRDKAGLEQLMKQDGHDFGTCHLRITPQSLKKKNEAKPLATPKAQKKPIKVPQNKAEKVEDGEPEGLNITPILDSQIDDLLSAIRSEEEAVELKEEIQQLEMKIQNEDPSRVEDNESANNDESNKDNDECEITTSQIENDGTAQCNSDNVFEESVTAKCSEVSCNVALNEAEPSNGVNENPSN